MGVAAEERRRGGARQSSPGFWNPEVLEGGYGQSSHTGRKGKEETPEKWALTLGLRAPGTVRKAEVKASQASLTGGGEAGGKRGQGKFQPLATSSAGLRARGGGEGAWVGG